MKKNILTIALSVALLGGCVTTDTSDEVQQPTNFVEVGDTIVSSGYQASHILELEKVRLPINETFVASKSIYDTYMAKVETSPAYYNYVTATQGKSDEEIIAIRNQLSAADLKTISEFEAANMDMLKDIMDLAIKLYAMNEAFTSISPTQMIMQAKWDEMSYEQDALSYTTDQISYLMDTVGHLYQLAKIDNANMLMS